MPGDRGDREAAGGVAMVAAEGASDAPKGPLPLTPTPKLLGLLLAEVRARFQEERDRHGQAFTRAGIYLAILGIYVNALVRFIDKPPVRNPVWLYWLFFGCGVLLLLEVCASGAFILSALIGQTVGQAILPHVWLKHLEEQLEPAFRREGITGAELDTGLDALMQEQFVRTLAEAVQHNSASNNVRFDRLYQASRLLFAGLVTLVVAAGLYFRLPSSPPTVPPVSVHCTVEPPVRSIHTASKEDFMANELKPVANGNPAAAPQTSSPSTPPRPSVVPAPPKVQYLRDGEYSRPPKR